MNAAALAVLFSVLVPAKAWFSPSAPLNVTADQDAVLMLADFAGKQAEAKGSAEAAKGKAVDVRALWPEQLGRAGTYVLYAVPKGKPIQEFVGTPVVIEVRSEKGPGGGNDVVAVRMTPLRYVVMSTDHGDMTWVFWHDVAPNTVAAIQGLVEGGFYDGLTFHRVVPGFVIQGGDPKGDGTGGPGFMIDAEFNERKHTEGVLSMARNGDERERRGLPPGPEARNSAGSQFFVCLGPLPNLDGKYTGFGQVTEGMETYKKIAALRVVDPQSGRPEKPAVITKAQIMPVTAQDNPYAGMMGWKK